MNKILVVGEFSGVGRSIVNSLTAKGFLVHHLTDGDTYKKIDRSISRGKYHSYVNFLFDSAKSIFNDKYELTIFLSPPAPVIYFSLLCIISSASFI